MVGPARAPSPRLQIHPHRARRARLHRAPHDPVDTAADGLDGEAVEPPALRVLVLLTVRQEPLLSLRDCSTRVRPGSVPTAAFESVPLMRTRAP